jgi:hypothetical protein
MTIGQDRPRLVVVDSLQLTSAVDPYLTLPALASYCGHSIRWLRDRLKDSERPLPHFRPPGGRVLVRRSEFDDWMATFRGETNVELGTIVTDILSSLRRA